MKIMHFGWFDSAHYKSAQCKQKGSVQLLLLLLSVLVISGAIFFYQSTRINFQTSPKISPVKNSRVEDSKNYIKTDLGFKFKFPKDLKVLEDSEEEFNKRGNGNYRKNFKGYVGYEPGEVLGAAAVLDETNSYKDNPFSVWVFQNSENLTTGKWFEKYWYYPFLWGVFDYTSKGHIRPDMEATISGEPAAEKTVSYQDGPPKYLYVSNNQKMYLFRIIGEAGDKILSSFKFIQ